MIKRRDWRANHLSKSGLAAFVDVLAGAAEKLCRAGLVLGLAAAIPACASGPKPGSLPVDPTPIAQTDEPIGGSASVVYAPLGCPAAGEDRCAVRVDAIAGKTPLTSPQ